MEASELRIGNIIHDNDKNCPFRGEHDTIVSHEIIYHIACNDKHTYEPIPLTEEWLVKLGFEKALNGWWDKTECFSVDNGQFRIGTDDIIKVNYVHQLQNLYFALTGEELTINT